MHTMNKRINIEQNRVFHLENSMIMYGVYNVDTLEKLIQMVHKINNRSIWYERLCARAQLISQHVDAGQLNVLPQQ